jgi:hypothetical protein
MLTAIRSTERSDNDTLDQVRGVLCALANRGETYFSPISTLSIRFSLDRRNREIAPADTLQLLYAIGDVQRLPGGYWLPVPTTLVQLGELAVVISGTPTQRLEDYLGTPVRSSGYSRVVPHLHVTTSSLPRRSFASWCGAPSSTTDWTIQYINAAAYSRQFVDNGFECFDHWSKRTVTRWLDSRQRDKIPDGVVLSRARSPVGTLHLLCKFRGGRPLAMCEIGYEWSTAWRLALGLRALHGNHARFRVRQDSETESTLVITRFLPSEETIVLHALGSARQDTATTLGITLDDASVPPMVQMLISLGLKQDGD